MNCPNFKNMPCKTLLCLLLIIPQILGLLNYCQYVKNCEHVLNIVCQRKHDCEPVEKCTEVLLKRSTKIYIMLSLNEYRNDVALGRVKNFPNASDMVTQYWEEDLEYVTACAQNTCEKQEEVCANTVKFAHTITLQNVLLLKNVVGEVEFFEQTIKTWLCALQFRYYHRLINEYKSVVLIINRSEQLGTKDHLFLFRINAEQFTRDQISQFTDSSSVTNAAVLWCNSPAIGCALSYDSNFYYGACTFAIAPRYGEHVYRAGDPCSGCPKGLDCNEEYHGLCGEIMLPRSSKGEVVRCGVFSLGVVVFRALIVFLG